MTENTGRKADTGRDTAGLGVVSGRRAPMLGGEICAGARPSAILTSEAPRTGVVRVRHELRAEIAAAAKRNGWSFADEVNHRLAIYARASGGGE